MKVRFISPVDGESRELALNKLTPEQLNVMFGEGNWEILEGGADALDSEEKMKRLGVKDKAGYLAVVKKGIEFRDEMAAFLKKEGVCYVIDGVNSEVTVGSGIYVQNPDKAPAALVEKMKKEKAKTADSE